MSYRDVDSTCVADDSQYEPVPSNSHPQVTDTTQLLAQWIKDVRPFLEHGCASFETSEPSGPSGFTFEGTLRVDCHLKGALPSGPGTLIVGKRGHCDANAHVGTALVEGVFNGNLHASELIQIAGEARVTGNIEAPAISIGRDAVFEGQCHMVPSHADSSHSNSLVHDPQADAQVVAAAS